MKIRKRWIALGALVVLIVGLVLLGVSPVPAEMPTPTSPSLAQPKSVCPSKVTLAAGTGQTLIVHPGDHIQDVVNQARPGDTIQIMPGTFHEGITVTVNHLTVQGVSQNGQRPVLDGEGKLANGVVACADQFDVENLEIRNYTDNGVIAENVDGVIFRNLLTDHTGDYGLFPVGSNHVTVENCVATGASDTGIYVGQSNNIVVNNSEAYANVSGIEIENSSNAVVTNNYSHGNTAGLLLFVLPDLSRKETSGNRIANNRLIANNLANFADKADIVAKVPAGTGLALIGTNNNEITGNEVRDNKSTGIAVVSLRQFIPERTTFDVDTEPRDNWIHDNTVENNGTDLDPSAKSLGLPGTDLLWDGNGWNNSWQETAARRFPPWLPGRDWSVFARRIYYRVLSVLQALP